MSNESLLSRLLGGRIGSRGADRPNGTESPTDTRFERMVEIAADAIISVDQNHDIVLFNRGAEEIFGYDRSEAIGRPLAMLLPERFRKYHRVHMDRFAEADTTARHMGERREIAGLRKDGREFPAEASISRIDTGDGALFTVLLRDITDRKKVEETQRFLADASAVLAQSLDYETTMAGLARLALPHLADWCVIDVAGDDGLRRIQAAHHDPELDRLAQRLLDHPPDPARPHPTLTVLETGEPEHIERIPHGFIEAIADGEEHQRILETLGVHSILVVPLVARARILGAFTLVSADARRPYDTEDSVLAQELGRRAAMAVDNSRLYREARDAIAARDEVLSVVSHDLGNPLSAIRVSSRVVETMLKADNAEAAGPQIDGIRAAVLQMERLIQDLLEVRRIESGRLKLVRRPEAVRDLVHEAVRTLRPVAGEQEVELVTDLDADLPRMIRVDADRIGQVFSNLIGNALKFTPAGGTITVGAERRNGEVRFWVRDTGAGMAPDALEHVFDRFWQARQQGSHGIGLGLAIAKGMAEAHGGRVDVESEEGVGSCFSFTVPENAEEG